jgi:putative tryptophan/tyrosine transport system substrate-binding protein
MSEIIRRRFRSHSYNRKSKTCTERRRSIENRKLAGIVALVVALVMCGAVAEAQQRANVATIGWLSATSGPLPGQKEIVRLLRDRGYIDGRNIAFEYRYAANRLDRLPRLAEELVRLNVDVLVTPGTPGALALKNATKTIPIVFTDVTDPVGAGLVDSLARPGHNLTGFSSIDAILAGKRLELLKETIPKLRRVAVLWDPQNASSKEEWKDSQRAARELGLQLHSMEVSSADGYAKAFDDATKARSLALVVLSTPLTSSNRQWVAELAIKNRLPSMYARWEFVANGGLMAYGPDQTERYRRVAALIDKILKGTKPSEIPVEQPTKFELVINLKAAKQIGLTIPPNVLARADKVIR